MGLIFGHWDKILQGTLSLNFTDAVLFRIEASVCESI